MIIIVELKFGIWYKDVLALISNLVDILLCVGVVSFEEIFLKCNLLRTLLGNEKRKKLGNLVKKLSERKQHSDVV